MPEKKIIALHAHPKSQADTGEVILSSSIRVDKNRHHNFQFRFAENLYDERMESHAAHHVLAHLMPAMRVGGELRVEGRLDRSMGVRMQSFMHYWKRWCPDRFHQVEIVPDEWFDAEVPQNREMISCFSGGVDSFYSLLRAEQDLQARMKSVLFMHGFDIDLSMGRFYEETADAYESWLAERSVRLLRVKTNARQTARRFQLHWGSMGHGVYLAAALHLFSHEHAMGCIPSSHSPDSPIVPWGSNPVTDPLCSSRGFEVIHHDYSVPRFEKMAELAKHNDCLSRIRVCSQIEMNRTNCGACAKCLATLAALEVVEPDTWRSVFPSVSSLDSAIRALHATHLNRFQIEQLEIARHHASLKGMASMAESLEAVIAGKQQHKASLGLSWDRWLYGKKLDVYLRYPRLHVR